MNLLISMSSNRVIGCKGFNDMPWNLPEYISYFEKKTRHEIIIMGKRTFSSLDYVPMSNRTHIVVTHEEEPTCGPANLHYVTEDRLWGLLHKLQTNEADDDAKEAEKIEEKEERNPPKLKQDVYVVGGFEIYRLLFPYCSRIYMTLINIVANGDVFSPYELENIGEIGNVVWQSNLQKSKINNTEFVQLEIQRPNYLAFPI